MAKSLPEVLTPEEQEKISKQFNKRYPTGFRNYSIVQLTLNTGLRVSEITSLAWNDINLMTGRVHVKNGKGGKDRILWVGESITKTLQIWREWQEGKLGIKSENVFTTLKGKLLSPRYIWGMVKRISRKAGIRKNISTHSL